MMSKTFRKTSGKVADFFAWSKYGVHVFVVGMLLVFGVGGGILVSILP
jgi:hypothetical protein